MKSNQINYITLMPIGDTDFKCYCETISGNHYEIAVSASDTIESILEKISNSRTLSEAKIDKLNEELKTKTEDLNKKDEKISKIESDLVEKDAHLNKIESDLTLMKTQIKEKDEEFKSILDALINKVNWGNLNFRSFTDVCSKLILLHVGDYISYNNKNYIVKKQHMPDPDETPEERPDLYFSINAKVKEVLVELVQGRKYAKGTIGSFRGTVYRCEVANNTAPIGTPGYWTNLGPVSNYK